MSAAVVWKVPLLTRYHAVQSFPTLSELWLRLVKAWQADGS